MSPYPKISHQQTQGRDPIPFTLFFGQHLWTVIKNIYFARHEKGKVIAPLDFRFPIGKCPSVNKSVQCLVPGVDRNKQKHRLDLSGA